MNEKQITPISKEIIQYIQFDMPFFITSAYISKSERKLTPLWPAPTDPTLDSYILDDSFHRHGHYEFIYVLDGVFTQHLEDSVYCLNPGDATFLNCNIRHFDGNETECSCIYMNFSPEFLKHLLLDNALTSSRPQHTCNQILQLYHDTDASHVENRLSLDFRQAFRNRLFSEPYTEVHAKTLINEIISELTLEKAGYGFRAEGLLLRLFSLLENTQHYHMTRVYTHSSTESILFADMQHYIQERYGRISRDELSSLLHYNSDYLGRIIKQHTGMTLSHYCQNLWMEKAKELLRTTDMSVTEIIDFLHFENSNHFFHTFYEATGVTPVQYREQHKLS